MHIWRRAVNEYHLLAHEEPYLGNGLPPRTSVVILRQADSRHAVDALQLLLSTHPEGERAIRRIVVKPIPCFLAPHFLRFTRGKDIAVEYDDNMAIGRHRQPLQALQDHQYGQR